MAVKEYTLADGSVGSRADKIREMFNADWTRGDIAKELEIPYSAVFMATANMENEHHGPGKRVGGFQRKMIELEDGTKMPRADYIRKRIEEGATRGDVAKELNVSYSAVWNATKNMDGLPKSQNGGRKYVEDPETGEEVPRAEYIRKRFKEGATRREIANELMVDYTVVWQATRKLVESEKTEDDNPGENEDQAAAEEQAAATAEDADADANAVDADDGGDNENFPE